MSKKKAVQKKFYAYIVECRDGTLYTGSTHDLEKRMQEHNNSRRGAKYTHGRRPVRLIWQCEYATRSQALKAEKSIQRMCRTQKKALVQATLSAMTIKSDNRLT